MTTIDTIEPAAPTKSRRRWLRFSLRTLLLLVAALAVLLVYLRSVMEWSIASNVSPALIRISRDAPRILADETEPPSTDSEFRNYKATQAALIKSNFVLQAVLRKPQIKRLTIVQNHKSDTLRWMQKHLVVEFLGDTEIVKVSFTDGPALERVAIINAVKEAYMDEIVNAERIERLRNRDVLDRLYRNSREELQRRTAQLSELRQTTGDSDANQARKRLLQKQLDALADRRNRVQERVYELDLLPESAAKETKDAADSDSKRERDACERQLAQLDASIEKQLQAIRELDTVSGQYELLRREHEVLTDHLKQLQHRLQVMGINLDDRARSRIQSIEDATVQ